MTPEHERPPLDVSVDRLRALPGHTFGPREGFLAVGAVLVSFVVVGIVYVVGGGAAAATGAGELALLVAVLWLARRAARRSGGWEAALGLGRPRWRDIGTVVGWTILLTMLQAGVVELMLNASPDLQTPSNTGGVQDLSTGALAGFFVLTVVVAPFVEELIFRGLLLRGLMIRIGFWPAAIVSSVLFGALHAPGAQSGALALMAAMTVFGFCLCLLVRYRGRLVLSMGVHALRNGLALAILVGAGLG